MSISPNTPTPTTGKYGPGGFGGFVVRTAAIITGGIALVSVFNILFGWDMRYRNIDLPKTWLPVLILGGVSAVLGYVYHIMTRRKTVQ